MGILDIPFLNKPFILHLYGKDDAEVEIFISKRGKKCKYIRAVHQQSHLMLSVGSFHYQTSKHFPVPKPMEYLVLQSKETKAQITTHSVTTESPTLGTEISQLLKVL